MKKSITNFSFSLFLSLFFTPLLFIAQGIGINATGADPHFSAMLDVDASNKGFLPPRLTTTQRDAITSPATGLVIYNTDTKCINFYDGIGWKEDCGTITYPLLGSLNCGSAINNGTLTAGSAASGVSSLIPYTGGNGGPYNGQIVSSTGVTGLTATLAPGTLAIGAGTLTYTITGTPSVVGTADFLFSVGGQSCIFSLTVNNLWSAGYVHCGGNVTIVVDVTNPTTGKTWMDRNLGANRVALSSTDDQAFGGLFQWGRFADGHQCINRYSGDGVTTSGETKTTSGLDTPGHASFIKDGDWRNPSNDNLWQGVKGVNNPCPSGYRLPTASEWNNERLSWGSFNSTGAFNAPLKLTTAGLRHNNFGTIVNSSYGNYWSSDFGGSGTAPYFMIENGTAWNTNARAMGCSVRCIKD